MNWSTKLADFIANAGRPEFRSQATQVIRELNKFDNPQAENGIAPMDVGGATGIGINWQQKKWFLLGAALCWGLLVAFAIPNWPPRLRDPGSEELSAWVILLPMFGGFGLLFVALFLKKSGPEVVVVASPTSLYVVSRAGMRFTPKEVLIPWSEYRARVDMNTVTHKGVTTHTVALFAVRRDNGRKSKLFGTRVDEQIFPYWQQFASVMQTTAETARPAYIQRG